MPHAWSSCNRRTTNQKEETHAALTFSLLQICGQLAMRPGPWHHPCHMIGQTSTSLELPNNQQQTNNLQQGKGCQASTGTNAAGTRAHVTARFVSLRRHCGNCHPSWKTIVFPNKRIGNFRKRTLRRRGRTLSQYATSARQHASVAKAAGTSTGEHNIIGPKITHNACIRNNRNKV